jgi:DNA-directed RNA polymerase specialized sigma24 family protein
MAETDDAMSLISPIKHPMELAYANYANSMKNLANQARKEMVTTGEIKYDANAKRTYQKEVDSLMDQLNTAELNRPRERRAQLLANTEVNAKINEAKRNNEKMKPGDIKKASQQALTKYRNEVNAKRTAIQISDREWEAIQAGAISESTLKSILKYTDVDNLRSKATPRATTTLSPAKVSKIQSMRNSNYSLQEIAKALGVSTSTVSEYLKGVN